MARARDAQTRMDEHARNLRRTEVELARKRSLSVDTLYKLHRKLVSWALDYPEDVDKETGAAITQLEKRVDYLVDHTLEYKQDDEAATLPFDKELL